MKIAIIGFGNLGRALATGLLKSGIAAEEVTICDNSADARATAESEYRVAATEDPNAAIGRADIIFLTVKGYVFDEISKTIDRRALADKTIVSFMAGVSFEKIYAQIGEVTLVRAMPSLAIAELDGVIGYTKAPAAVAEIFDKLGYAFETEPEDIEKVMAFSSCGLGFAAYLIDTFAAAGQTMGFSDETSARIAALTFKNAVERGNYKATVKAVATPGGATEQGILHMDENHLYETVSGAVRKAYDRMRII